MCTVFPCEEKENEENSSTNVMLFRWVGIVMDVMGGLVMFFAAMILCEVGGGE